tara:strand:- start:12293 stop:13147 length:855 start_codon:yes stop_codon:yes gene_type:complete
LSRVSYINGSYVPHKKAFIHIEDRGNQFADGVYEVIPVRFSSLIDFDLHIDRLEKNLKTLTINFQYNRRTLNFIFRRLIFLNKITNGIIYFQISRGNAKREHAFPKNIDPTFFVTARNNKINHKIIEEGVNVITTEDIRWGRCDIKTISLLPNVLAKQKAVDNDAFEALLLDQDSIINEGSSSNFWIIKEKKLFTGPISKKVLPGITRKVLKDIIIRENLEISEQKFSLEDALKSSEAMLTNSSNVIIPVVKINDNIIGDGVPGVITLKLHKLIEKNILDQIIN